MKTKTAIELAGSSAELARIFGITQSAVTQWGDELPDGRVWQLKVLKPKWFKTSKRSDSTKPATTEAA